MSQLPLDASGISGCIMHYTIFFALLGSALLIFLYLWFKGRLDMDETPKMQMMESDEYPTRRSNE